MRIILYTGKLVVLRSIRSMMLVRILQNCSVEHTPQLSSDVNLWQTIPSHDSNSDLQRYFEGRTTYLQVHSQQFLLISLID